MFHENGNRSQKKLANKILYNYMLRTVDKSTQ